MKKNLLKVILTAILFALIVSVFAFVANAEDVANELAFFVSNDI